MREILKGLEQDACATGDAFADGEIDPRLMVAP
jgi:hypothetical protein